MFTTHAKTYKNVPFYVFKKNMFFKRFMILA